MPVIHRDRHTADVRREVVVFLIGMRINSLRDLAGIRLAAVAMPRMLRQLADDPELGLLHVEHFRRGRTTLAVQYWESHDKLQRFATDPDQAHAAAWRAFMRHVTERDGVGIWHETYVVPAGNAEAVYGNMPVFGLAAATRHAPVGEVGRAARARMTHSRTSASRSAGGDHATAGR